MDSSRPWLTLDALERNDPRPQRSGRHTRYLCPLPACTSREQSPNLRTLSVELRTGVWHCDTCGAGGLLLHYQPPPEATSQREQTPKQATRPPAVEPSPPPVDERRMNMAEAADRYATLQNLTRTPGALYVSSRGIPVELAVECGVRYGRINGRTAVIFPVRDRVGQLVGINTRFLTVAPGQIKAMSGGPLGLGVFATPGALVAPRIAICEAAFDALSLAAAGLPAIALIGTTSRPDWLRTALSRTQVAIATDADVAGDAAAQSLATWLSAGSKPIRMRPPEEHKDWNGALLGLGLDSLSNQLSSVARGTASEAGAPPTTGDALHLGDDARWAMTSDGRVPDTPTYHAAVTVYERLRRVIEDLRLAADASVDPDIAARLRAEAFALQCGPYWEAGETIQDEIDALEEQPASPPVRLV